MFQFQTETDLLQLGFLAARQPDTNTVVTWEVAGTAHADTSTLEYGIASGQVWAAGETAIFDPAATCGQINWPCLSEKRLARTSFARDRPYLERPLAPSLGQGQARCITRVDVGKRIAELSEDGALLRKNGGSLAPAETSDQFVESADVSH